MRRISLSCRGLIFVFVVLGLIRAESYLYERMKERGAMRCYANTSFKPLSVNPFYFIILFLNGMPVNSTDGWLTFAFPN